MIKLKFFTEEEFKLLISWITTPELMVQWSGAHFKFPLDQEQLIKYSSFANQENSTEYIYKVIEADSDEIIGHISLGRIDRVNESARIGKVFISPAARGKGYASEMIRQILAIAFNELKLNRVSLGVFDFNRGAIKVYEKAGFQKEGLLRQTNKVKNEYWNLIEMGILRSEWHEQTGPGKIQSNV
ncbi:GNAT family N-acetyltransferase [Bacillus sp. ISL-47]|uniref:GNAT family N-acetyltransferase n=1 Tax=Bacillus sp. ISL-47 TaxID=2819130 RepID=UPI001BE62922|nr:GNAT family protein [Bacillus sp. ISL-47]MBT2691152.1 GNAT family N-acetyltransferase [Bacillus sp. ISL-47]MBT2711060.1 GNAT family N-acetyltransferase [Pseudomonas sp. ISL-84]